MVLGLFALAAASMAPCTVERARYAMRHHPDWTAYFRLVDSGPEWPSALALAVHDRKSGHTNWWLPWNGGTDGLGNVASTLDVTAKGWRPPSPDGGPRPHGNRQYLGFDAHYDIIEDVPRRDHLAPSHMLFPDSAGSGDGAFGFKAFFDLVACPGRGS